MCIAVNAKRQDTVLFFPFPKLSSIASYYWYSRIPECPSKPVIKARKCGGTAAENKLRCRVTIQFYFLL